MLKERTIEVPCRVLHQDVKLSVACFENDNASFQSPSLIAGCDCYRQCGVRTEKCLHWERCAYYKTSF